MARVRVSTGTWLLVGPLALYVLTIAVLVLFGDELAGGGSAPDTSDILDAPARAANLLSATDQIIGMLFTTSVGLIVGVGVIFRDRDFRIGLSNLVQMAFVVLFTVATICSIYFGYTARTHAVLIANYSLTEYTAINEFVGRQALAVVVAAGAALSLFVFYLTDKHAAAVSVVTAGARPPAPRPPDKPRQPRKARKPEGAE